jgi:hypothetical protein
MDIAKIAMRESSLLDNKRKKTTRTVNTDYLPGSLKHASPLTHEPIPILSILLSLVLVLVEICAVRCKEENF